MSPLYPTTPAIYRALGWEVVGSLTTYRIPALALAGLRIPEGMTLRPAGESDVDAVLEVYRSAADATDGLLDREVPLRTCTAAEMLARADGYTAAIGPEGRLEGYAAWNRGPGYGADSVLDVSELLASTARAYAALIAMLGSWSSVAPALDVQLLDADALLVPTPLTSLVRHERWMSRILDAGRAVAQRGWPAGAGGAVGLDLVDELVPEHSGRAQLVVEDGTGRWEPGGRGEVRLHVRALAVLLAGGSTTHALRRAGLLTGDLGAAATLDAWCARPRPQLLDYF